MLRITELVSEYLKDPVGLDMLQPRLSWKLISTENNTVQRSYRIICALSETALNKQEDLTWDSGIVESDQSAHVTYSGTELRSSQRIFWKVKAWDYFGNESDWSQTAFWETGLLKKSDWKAKWIEANILEDPAKANPCPYLRTEFIVDREIEQARIYVSARGLYRLQLNGKKVGDEEFTPGWTNYHARLQYQVFDVSSQVQKGRNALGAILGDGWFRGNLGWQGLRNHYGKKTALLLQLVLNYSDGSAQVVLSDNSWKSSTGAILESEIYHGEVFDARLEKTGWDTPGFDDSAWPGVILKDYGVEKLTGPVGPKVKVTEEIKAIEKILTPKGETVIDFGQNLVGRIRFSLKGQAGEKISVYHAEVLDREGNFYTTNLRPARQRIEYIFKGVGTESYSPHFAFMGFRYIKIEDYAGEIVPEAFVAEVIHSDMEFTGDFECSDELVNRLQQNIRWGLRGNFLDIPTDCPQRDERLGWTGDAQVFASTANYIYNTAPFFTKWMKDLESEQRSDGSVPWVVPNIVVDGGGTGWSDGFGATGWADAAIIIPWEVYRAYGDLGILEQQYNSMRAWEEYMIREAGDSYLFNTGFHFGDWLSFAEYSSYIYNAPDYGFAGAHTEKDLIATAYFYYSTRLMAEIARITGRAEDSERYKALLPKIKTAFAKEFITPNGRLLSNTQTAYALALAFGIIPEEYEMTAREQLAKNVEHFQHLTTGFLGTPVLCQALSDSNRTDLAYKLLFNKKYPSWLYPVTMGATTIWERWDGIKPDGSFQDEGMNSFNHYAYGAIGNWLYTRAAGIQCHLGVPGYKSIIIKPELTDRLAYVRATLNTMYGKIGSCWELENGRLTMIVTVPPNTSATVYVPQKGNTFSTHNIGSGTFEFHSIIE